MESGENPGAPGTVKLCEEEISQIHASRIAMHLPAPECMDDDFPFMGSVFAFRSPHPLCAAGPSQDLLFFISRGE